ncbi:MAG: carbohydrate binding domain-containing protein [Acidobacteriota bacterium]|nr:carbohydrate binding domain-containing protein [Acidobacteriota bacterium]
MIPLRKSKIALCLSLAAISLSAQPVLHINAATPGPPVSPSLYGLMTEEINFSYDGGLYAELVRNRSFKENAKDPVHWRLVQESGGAASIALDPSQPLNQNIATSLKLTVASAPAGIANEGFWGIPVRPATRYRASFFAKAAPDFKGPLTISIRGNDDGTVYASAQVTALTADWKRYEVTLSTTSRAPTTAKAHLLLSAGGTGTLWLSMVSLFPPTVNNRPNGNRKDIQQILADMQPKFLRFPGGNYLEGNTIETRFEWKKTIGPIWERPGHMNDAWNYWSSDGMGLLEFLEWCEDLHMQPVLGVYAGYSLKQQRVKPGADLAPFVAEALDEIEYITGSTATTWGARRAKDGHPAPFNLEYVEIGNEDEFDREPGSHDGRFAQFFDAVKAKYPQLKVIATTRAASRVPDVLDEHYYRRSEDEMASHAHDYDKRPRTGPKVFVGEWATRVGDPTPNMSAALGDAAWMTGMENNSDLVIMSSYAPLFVNVNPGGMQWKTNLIGFDALTSYGSPAYYAQKMFSNYHGDVVLPVSAEGIPTRTWQPPARRGETTAPPPQEVPTLFYGATRDGKSGTVYLKVVNRAASAQSVRVEFAGMKSVKGQAITLAANSPNDTNSIAEPTKIVPVTSSVDGLGTSFTRAFPPYSVTVLVLKSR